MSSQENENFSNQKEIKKILIFMRHLEKLIKTGQVPKCGKFDSELSPLGTKQAILSGQKFISQLKKLNFSNISPSEIHIISSPYILTLQTTAYFLKGIESQKFFENKDIISNLYNISIEYGIREILNSNKLKGEKIPKDFLNFLNNPKFKDFDEELKKLNLNIISDEEFSTKIENGFELNERCKKYVDEKLINFDKNNKFKVIIIISHSGPMQCILRRLGLKIKNVHDIKIGQQYYFDITKGIGNANFIEKVDFN